MVQGPPRLRLQTHAHSAVSGAWPPRCAGGLLSFCRCTHFPCISEERGEAPPTPFFFLRGLSHSPCIQTRSLPRTRLWGRFLLQVGMGSGVFSLTAVCPCNAISHGRGRRDLGVTEGTVSLLVPLLLGVFSLLCLKERNLVRSWETMVCSHAWAGHRYDSLSPKSQCAVGAGSLHMGKLRQRPLHVVSRNWVQGGPA